MYNGIGLQTPRGSGTSGHVQASRFLAKPRPSSSAGGGTPNPPHTGGSGLDGARKPNKDILEHDRKRQVELRLLVLRDALEEQGYSEAEIEERVGEARKTAEIEAAAEEEEGGLRSKDKGYGRKEFLCC
jgi:serine/arginine repetitive matrix protein 2